MSKRRNWSDAEIEVVLSAYDSLLSRELDGGIPHGMKAKVRRAALADLDNRSAGSFEMKMMNVSAARESLGLPVIDGYKPYGHAQKALVVAIRARGNARAVAA